MRQLFNALSARLLRPARLLTLPSPAWWGVTCARRRYFKQHLALLLVATASPLAVTAQRTPPAVQYPKLSKTLDSLAYVDQWPMQQMFRQLPDSAGRHLVEVEKENYARHQPVLEKIVHQYGYPGVRQVGKTRANNFWLMVQHADAHPAFQRQVLLLMLPQVKRKNASAVDYAYLTDRVALNTGQLAEYGTQVMYEGSGPTLRAVARPLRDPARVNQRRAAVGLEPLETYLANCTKTAREMNAPKDSGKEAR